jgi:hypothetical protein
MNADEKVKSSLCGKLKAFSESTEEIAVFKS